MEERKKQSGPPSPPDKAIEGGKARLILEEIEKNDKELAPPFKGRIPGKEINRGNLNEKIEEIILSKL